MRWHFPTGILLGVDYSILKCLNQGAKEMTEEVKKVANKPEDLSSISGPI